MIHSLLQAITDEMIHRNPRFQHGISLGFMDKDGRVMKQKDAGRNEFEWAGIDDGIHNYFYIRHRTSGLISHEPSQGGGKAFSSCSPNANQVSRYELRLVACLHNYCPYTLEREIRTSLIMARFPLVQGMSKVSAIPVTSDVNSMGVVEEETGKARPFDPNLNFVAVDFDLTMEISYF